MPEPLPILYLPLAEHAAAVQSAARFIRDERYSESSRRGARKWLDSLLNDYFFVDNSLNGGYAIKISWELHMRGQTYVI